MSPQSAVAAVFSAALAAPALAGCGAGKQAAAVVIVLPDPGGATDLSDITRTVRLSVGQVVGVQVKHRDLPSGWRQVSAGSAAVLRPDGEDTVKGCPAGRVGCGATVRERYRAVSAGTMMLEWDYVGMGPGTLPSGVPTTACPGFGAGAQCPVGVMKIVVTVR